MLTSQKGCLQYQKMFNRIHNTIPAQFLNRIHNVGIHYKEIHYKKDCIQGLLETQMGIGGNEALARSASCRKRFPIPSTCSNATQRLLSHQACQQKPATKEAKKGWALAVELFAVLGFETFSN